MADTAAHLVDRVFPHVPVRQGVLSFPHALRYRLAYDSDLITDVLDIFVKIVFVSLIRRAAEFGAVRKAQCGADFAGRLTKLDASQHSFESWPHLFVVRRGGYKDEVDRIISALRGNQPVSLSLLLTIGAGHRRNRFQLDRASGNAAYDDRLNLPHHFHIAIAALQALSNRGGELARTHVRSRGTRQANDDAIRDGASRNPCPGRDGGGRLLVFQNFPVLWTSDSQPSEIRYQEVGTRLHRRDRDGGHACRRWSRCCGSVRE